MASNETPQAGLNRRTKYLAVILIAMAVSVSLGYTLGFNAGVKSTPTNVGRPPNWRNILISGIVSIGSLGTPRTITFDSPGYGNLSSAISSINNQNQYRVYLLWPAVYNVTIFYQDSSSQWQHCPANPRTFAPGSELPQNFNC
jgi:hypothetical protein